MFDHTPPEPTEPLPTDPPDVIGRKLAAIWLEARALEALRRDPELEQEVRAAIADARAALADVRRERGR